MIQILALPITITGIDIARMAVIEKQQSCNHEDIYGEPDPVLPRWCDCNGHEYPHKENQDSRPIQARIVVIVKYKEDVTKQCVEGNRNRRFVPESWIVVEETDKRTCTNQ